MTPDEAFEHIRAAVEAGHPAHAYLVVGQVRGEGGALAERILRLLFGEGELRVHPDVHFLAPALKSRIISVEAIHEQLLEPMGKTAFQGGWKAGVIQGVDRLHPVAANAFLKMLEEPPPKTLFLLLTSQPEQLLPTIISRCQRVDLPDARNRQLAEPWRSRVLDILAREGLTTLTARAAAAADLAAILAEIKASAETEVDAELAEKASDSAGEMPEDEYAALVSARYRETRADFTATLMSWFRDLMALVAAPPSHSAYEDDAVTPLVNAARRGLLETRAARLSRTHAFHNIEAVEEFAASLERNMNEAALLGFLMDRVALGTEGA